MQKGFDHVWPDLISSPLMVHFHVPFGSELTEAGCDHLSPPFPSAVDDLCPRKALMPAKKAIELTPPPKQGCSHRCNEERQKLGQPNARWPHTGGIADGREI
jgi:hypothetical protein